MNERLDALIDKYEERKYSGFYKWYFTEDVCRDITQDLQELKQKDNTVEREGWWNIFKPLNKKELDEWIRWYRKNVETYKVIQDNDSHWYRIPISLIEDFKLWCDNGDDELRYDEYRTGWHPDLTPYFYE